jgi:hypothetical protein
MKDKKDTEGGRKKYTLDIYVLLVWCVDGSQVVSCWRKTLDFSYHEKNFGAMGSRDDLQQK